MAVSKQTEEWYAAALENSIAAMREKPGVRDYETVDPPVFNAYVLQHFASFCLVNGETNPKVACRMIGWDGKLPDKRLGGIPRNIFRDQWNRALEFARNQIYEGVCRKFFGGIVDGRGTSGVNTVVRNAMEKDASSIKYSFDGEDRVAHPVEGLRDIGFTDITEDLYEQAAVALRQNVKKYTNLRSKRAPNLAGEVMGDFDFGDFGEDEDDS